jgi:hypothetical protein
MSIQKSLNVNSWHSRILLTNQQIFTLDICMNVNTTFRLSANIHIREYIFVVFTSGYTN